MCAIKTFHYGFSKRMSFAHYSESLPFFVCICFDCSHVWGFSSM